MFLSDQKTSDPIKWPRVSIVVAARNEAEEIESAIRSLLKLDYPFFEVIVVNDRSTDQTPDILKELSFVSKKLKCVQLEKTEKGWLGKNYALWRGYLESKGELILFTDADVSFHPQALKEAVGYLTENKCAHLTALPGVKAKGFLVTPVLVCFSTLMLFLARPWKIRDIHSADALGVGAFNLIRKDVYIKIGGHQKIAMEVVDDIELARLVKKNGFSSDVVIGIGRIQLWWHKTLMGIVRGLEKNAFAAVKFSYFMVVISSGGLLMLYGLPFMGVIFYPGMWKGISCLAILCQFIIFWSVRRFQPASILSFVLVPLGMFIMVWILVRSSFVTTIRGGILWRDSFYARGLFPKTTWRSVMDVLRGRY